ncbi:TPM domain-containing protein [Patescibacteria group bacterium]|nr:TPM domain-containing protein [Patescibacteria group bacterium]
MSNKIAKIGVVFTVLFFGLILSPFALADLNLPERPEGYVTDQAQILNNQAELEETLANFEEESSNEIAVVTIPSLEGNSIDDYAVSLFQKWGIGKKGQDNGILLLISRDDRELKIETGYGLEGALPDVTADSIIRNEITPFFKEGDYSTGTTKGVEAIVQATRGEYEATITTEDDSALGGLIGVGVFGIVVVIMIIITIRGRGKYKDQGGSGSSSGGSGDSSWTSSSGGWSSGSGGSSSSFGGFGGGSSGGGGASGRW